MKSTHTLGAVPSRRLPIEVPEPRAKPVQIDQMGKMRAFRLKRSEAEVVKCRRQSDEKRNDFRAARQKVREAEEHEREYWATARRMFMNIEISSAEFVRRKHTYQKLQLETASIRRDAQLAYKACRESRRILREAVKQVALDRKQVEKLDMLKKLLHEQEPREI